MWWTKVLLHLRAHACGQEPLDLAIPIAWLLEPIEEPRALVRLFDENHVWNVILQPADAAVLVPEGILLK